MAGRNMASRFRELLLAVAREITPEELEEMKFLCVDFLPDTKPEVLFVKEVFNFFRGLESAGQLGEDNLQYLEYLLSNAKRNDLALRVKNFQHTKDNLKGGTTLPSESTSESNLQNESETNADQIHSCEDTSKCNENKKTIEEEESVPDEDAAQEEESVPDEDAAQKRKRDKRRRQKATKERKKAEKSTSKENRSSYEPQAHVEQGNPLKEQKEPEKNKQEVPKREGNGQETSKDKKQEYSVKDEEQHHGKGKWQGQEHNVEEKQVTPGNSAQGNRSSNDTHKPIFKHKPEVPERKKQSVVNDEQGHTQTNKQGPSREDTTTTTEERKSQQTKVSNPDLAEVKMGTGHRDSNDDAFKKLCILVLCTKWHSWGESIPMLNRELCLALARAGHRVACLVLTSSELEREEARNGDVELIQCSDKPGIKRDDPQLLNHDQPIPFPPNLVIGHGKVTGPSAVFHAEKSQCPRLHVIHDLPKESIKYDEVVNDQCNEEELAKESDFVAAIGTLLAEKWEALINREVIEIIPGLPNLISRNSMSSPQCRCFVPTKFRSPIASGLKIALMAVNRSSKRESRPRGSTIIVSNTDSSCTKIPAKVLKACNKNNVDLVERPGNKCQEAYFDIQGATVFLSPAKVEAFGVAALDAIAIGVPIFISAHSGLAFTILKHFEAKFHPCIKERGDENDEEDEDADIWAICIDKVAMRTKEAFASADELRSEWKKKFTWDMVAEQLMSTIVKSGKLSSYSPTALSNNVTTGHVAPSYLHLVKDLNLFDKRQKCVLFLSPEDPRQLINAAHLGLVYWAAVFDFDRESTTNGYLKRCEIFLQSIGKPACRMIPYLKDGVGKETSQNVTLPNGIPWILLQGLPEIEINVDDNLDWIQEILRLLKKKHPNPITILIIWRTTNQNKNLCKALCKLLTLVQASPSWKNSVQLKILSTSDVGESWLDDIAEEWGVAISKKIDISQLCNAIYSNAISNPLYQLDPDFSIPKRNANSTSGDVTCEILPSSSRWVDSVLEVLYTTIGDRPEFEKEDAHHFYRGGKISWYGIEMNYAVKRESWERLKKTLEEELGYAGAKYFQLFHRRGTGGTTSARKLLYDFRLRYPCVCLKTINYETFLAIKEIWKFCSLPVIILADINIAGAEDNDIEALFANLSNDKVSCLILHIVHRHQVDDKETRILAKHLTKKEREDFAEAYTVQCPPKATQLSNLKRAVEELQTPFYYGLVAFEERFESLEPYVSDCLQELSDCQRTALCFLSMAYHYARRELPLSALAGIFKLKPRQLHSIEDILSLESIELLIEEDECWRPRHFTIGKEILHQLLTVPFGIHQANWKCNLAKKAIEFVSYMEEEITRDILLNRISDEKTHQHFSSLVEDIPESNDVVKVFKKAISINPNNPHFKVHLGRFYSVKMGIQGFTEALQYTDEGILLASEKSRNVRSQLTQMRGMVYKREVKNQIDRKADLNAVFILAEEGVKSFTRSRAVSISSDKPENASIPLVRMMCDVFKYINQIHKGGVFEYSKLPNANRFILDGISGEISDILESVSESIFYPDLRLELFRLGIHGGGPNRAESKADLIKHLQELKRTSKASTAPINRQIVLIRLEQCKEKNKPVSEIAEELKELLEKALKYDKKIDLTMRLWVKVAPHIPVDLQAAESKIAAWSNKGKTALSYLYRYICTCIRILEGGRDQRFEDERMFARDELSKSVRDTSRINLRHADRPVVFLGTKKGMGQLVTLERESVIEVRKQRNIPDSYASQLRRLTGIITKTGKVGQIKAAGLAISFRADLCQPALVGESYLNKKVCFYLAFTYFETDAYNVKIVAE